MNYNDSPQLALVPLTSNDVSVAVSRATLCLETELLIIPNRLIGLIVLITILPLDLVGQQRPSPLWL